MIAGYKLKLVTLKTIFCVVHDDVLNKYVYWSERNGMCHLKITYSKL